MPVNLSIKSVPDSLIELLRKQAESNHRSLQGELMTILETNLRPSRRLSAREAIQKLNEIDITTRSTAARVVRHDRDSR